MTSTDLKESRKPDTQKNGNKEKGNGPLLKRIIGMGGGILLFALMALSSPPEGLSQEGWFTAAVALLMAVWWATEVIPIPATALLPLVLFRFSTFPISPRQPRHMPIL